ncbi:MAG: GreA/GreB family elongation factor [Myxococcota bacterium]
MLSQIAKKTLVEKIRARTETQLHALTNSQRVSQEGAVHEETRAEDPKDTRATEASYLARGLAERTEHLRAELERLEAFVPTLSGPEEAVKLGALVRVAEEGAGDTIYFLLPAGGGESISAGGAIVRVLSPLSPVGQALMGRERGEEFTLVLPRGLTTFVIEELR